MRLSQLFGGDTSVPDIEIGELRLDSRAVTKGDVFVAMPGTSVDGRQFIADALQQGAAAVLCEPPLPCNRSRSAAMISVPDLREQLGYIAARYYGLPSEDMLVLATTGTNGKTSCSSFAAEALSLTGFSAGYIGTLGFGLAGAVTAGGLTTPDPITLQRRLAELRDDGCAAASIEASSHGLAQGRLNGTDVDIAIFTNITRDHLDYHEDFSGYQDAKARLFAFDSLDCAVLNADDPFSAELQRRLANGITVLTTSSESTSADVYARGIRVNSDGLSFQLVGPFGRAPVQTSLMGRFNVANLLSTAAVLGYRGLAAREIADVLEQLHNVAGRMDVVSQPGGCKVVIDYAHTPDALEKALAAVKEHSRGEVWCVFGCGGDRDRGKRTPDG